MTRKHRVTLQNNIIILCEGTETEFRYFENARKYLERECPERFSQIKVVPVSSEKIQTKNPNRKETRKVKMDDKFHYYCKFEESEELYNKYKAQPTRYVRETQLYMKEDGYIEGWAVFDRDERKGIKKDHATAFQVANEEPKCNIAFSSYCFEEWLLAHFVRDIRAFEYSECTEEYDQTKCGTGLPGDCGGELCLAGQLRKKGRIEDYAKDKEGLFESLLMDRALLNTALINAVWLQSLSTKDVYECNPYTDVDKLIVRLLNVKEVYKWIQLGAIFSFASTTLKLEKETDYIKLTNTGRVSCTVVSSLFYVDESYQKELPVNVEKPVIPAGESVYFPLRKGYNYVVVKDMNARMYIQMS